MEELDKLVEQQISDKCFAANELKLKKNEVNILNIIKKKIVSLYFI